MIDNFEDRPFLGTKEFPGPRGENEGIPSGDSQRAHEKILVGRQMGRELEGIWKKAWADFVSSRETDTLSLGDVLMMSAMAAKEGVRRKGGRACLEGGRLRFALFDGGT